MSSRQRLQQILVESGLADRDLEAERIRAQRDVARTQALSSLLGNLVPQAISAGGAAYDAASKADLEKAQAYVAGKAGDVGKVDDMPGGETDPVRSKYDIPTYLKAPGEQAKADIDENPDLKPIKTGNPLLDVFAGIPNSIRSSTAAKATAARTQQIQADRAAARAAQMAQAKAESDDAHRAFEEGMGLKKLDQDDRHFEMGLDEKATDREVAKAEKAADRKLTTGEGALNRSSAERRADKALAAADKRAATAAEAKAAGRPLPAKEAVSFGAIESTIKLLDRIGIAKQGVNTGPLPALQNWAARGIAQADPQVIAFKSHIGDQLAQYIKSISGAAVSESERAALMQNVPSFTDDDEEFTAKLEATRERLQFLQDAKITALDAAGYDVSKFGGGTGVPQGPAPSQQASEFSAAYGGGD